MSIRAGDDLRLAITTATTQRPALITDLLYERQILMMSGEPGVGKSLISTQLSLACTKQSTVFDFFEIPKPINVYYLQLEGTEEEACERIRRMEARVPCETANLCWHYRIGLNLLELLQVETLIKQIAQWGKRPDLIVIDPLYQTVFGELSRELPSKSILRFLDAAREAFSPCAFLLVHHTKKPQYEGKQRVEEDDPYFGSQWLKAYVDTAYLLKPGPSLYRDQVILLNKKARGGDVVKEIILHYDPETDTCTTDVPPQEQSGYERVLKFLFQLKKEGKYSNFFEVQQTCKLSSRQLRTVQLRLLAGGRLKCDKYVEHHKLWEPL